MFCINTMINSLECLHLYKGFTIWSWFLIAQCLAQLDVIVTCLVSWEFEHWLAGLYMRIFHLIWSCLSSVFSMDSSYKCLRISCLLWLISWFISWLLEVFILTCLNKAWVFFKQRVEFHSKLLFLWLMYGTGILNLVIRLHVLLAFFVCFRYLARLSKLDIKWKKALIIFCPFQFSVLP